MGPIILRRVLFTSETFSVLPEILLLVKEEKSEYVPVKAKKVWSFTSTSHRHPFMALCLCLRIAFQAVMQSSFIIFRCIIHVVFYAN